MLDCISVGNMRLSNAGTIAKYVPSLELMRRAAEGVFRAVCWHGRAPSWWVPAITAVTASRWPAFCGVTVSNARPLL